MTCGILHQVFPARDISACLADTAAGILDERTCDDVCADFCRLCLLRELTVAVVHCDDDLGLDALCCFCDLRSIAAEQSSSSRISSRLLNEDDLCLICDAALDALDIGITRRQELYLFVLDSVRSESHIVHAAADAYGGHQRIVRPAGNREHLIAGSQACPEHRRD